MKSITLTEDEANQILLTLSKLVVNAKTVEECLSVSNSVLYIQQILSAKFTEPEAPTNFSTFHTEVGN